MYRRAALYHLTALLQPGDDHSDARQRIAHELNALADNLPSPTAVILSR